jgi:hypothetical protein
VSTVFRSLLLAALLGWAGAKGAVWVVTDTAMIIASRGWVPATATVERAWLERSSSRGGPEFSPQVVYSFDVAGRKYTGNRFEIPSRRSGDEVYERRRLAAFAPGTQVQILYDPHTPESNVLTRPQMNYWFTLGLGGLALVLLGFSLNLVYAGLRSLTIVGGGREAR